MKLTNQPYRLGFQGKLKLWPLIVSVYILSYGVKAFSYSLSTPPPGNSRVWNISELLKEDDEVTCWGRHIFIISLRRGI